MSAEDILKNKLYNPSLLDDIEKNDNDNAMSDKSSKIIKEIDIILDFILENPTDPRLIGCAKKIITTCTELINIAKERAKEERDNTRRSSIVKNAQIVVNFSTQLAQISRTASIKQDQAIIKALTDCASKLKASCFDLVESMRLSNSNVDEKSEDSIYPSSFFKDREVKPYINYKEVSL
eukprot:TRINITY_DN10926_c0_g1_i1.p1 TRINITY_DN10926_c0_g1~~TRINITY_DN10926_c0_g1_i1.p1  ORF type:complete len:189 (+),score=55.72 TRINITY_DN10926_c0_g1_i1:33-569(+)